MYETYLDKKKKQLRSRRVESFGYVPQLVSETIPATVAFCKESVQKKNEENALSLAEEISPRAFNEMEKTLAIFLVPSIITIDILAFENRFSFRICDMIEPLIYVRILYLYPKVKGSIFCISLWSVCSRRPCL